MDETRVRNLRSGGYPIINEHLTVKVNAPRVVAKFFKISIRSDKEPEAKIANTPTNEIGGS
jgi:hypothetical protein